MKPEYINKSYKPLLRAHPTRTLLIKYSSRATRSQGNLRDPQDEAPNQSAALTYSTCSWQRITWLYRVFDLPTAGRTRHALIVSQSTRIRDPKSRVGPLISRFVVVVTSFFSFLLWRGCRDGRGEWGVWLDTMLLKIDNVLYRAKRWIQEFKLCLSANFVHQWFRGVCGRNLQALHQKPNQSSEAAIINYSIKTVRDSFRIKWDYLIY